MDENKKISYRPNITYTDEYESDITFPKDNNTDSDSSNDSDKSEIDDLIDQGDNIQSMIDKLPGELPDIIKDHLDPIIDFVYNELKNKELEKVPVELEWNYDPYNPDPGYPEEDEYDPSIDDPDWGNMWDPNDSIVIIKEYHTKEEIVQKEYVKNLYDLFNDYFNKLHSIISNFWSTLLFSIMNKQSNEINMILNDILLNSSQIKDDKKHLLDSAVKSEINKNMKLNFFSNNFDAEGSMKHLKQFKAVYELRLRYAKISKNEKPVTRAEQISNNVLESMNLTYSNKYDKSYTNLYRYLESSNMILEDSLNSAAQSIKTKWALIDTKGVK